MLSSDKASLACVCQDGRRVQPPPCPSEGTMHDAGGSHITRGASTPSAKLLWVRHAVTSCNRQAICTLAFRI